MSKRLISRTDTFLMDARLPTQRLRRVRDRYISRKYGWMNTFVDAHYYTYEDPPGNFLFVPKQEYVDELFRKGGG